MNNSKTDDRVWRIKITFATQEVSGSATVKVRPAEANYSAPKAVEIAKRKLLERFDANITGTKFLNAETPQDSGRERDG